MSEECWYLPGFNSKAIEKIKISGGTVTATGGMSGGAGIGGGYAYGSEFSVNDITISGGTVKVARGNTNSQDIGNGNNGSAASITIDGGSVYAFNGTIRAGNSPGARNSAGVPVYENALSFNPSLLSGEGKEADEGRNQGSA